MAEKETPEIVDNADLQNEETANAATLKPGAGSAGGDTKAETLATFTSLLSQLGKEDLSNLFNQVQDQYGANKAPGAEDKSAANKASIKSSGAAAAEPIAKLSVKEDIDDMFSGDDLSEELKERAEVVFEAALNTRITLETARLEEEFAAKEAALEEAFEEALQEKTEEVFEEVTAKLDLLS